MVTKWKMGQAKKVRWARVLWWKVQQGREHARSQGTVMGRRFDRVGKVSWARALCWKVSQGKLMMWGNSDRVEVRHIKEGKAGEGTIVEIR